MPAGVKVATGYLNVICISQARRIPTYNNTREVGLHLIGFVSFVTGLEMQPTAGVSVFCSIDLLIQSEI